MLIAKVMENKWRKDMDTATTSQNFDDWFAAQRAAGLKDIKLVVGNRKGASVRQVQEDIVSLYGMAEAGLTKSLPLADGVVPGNISKIITQVSI